MSHKTWPHKVRFRSTLYLFFPKYKLSVCDQRSSTGRQKKIKFFQSVTMRGYMGKGKLIFSYQVSHLDTLS